MTARISQAMGRRLIVGATATAIFALDLIAPLGYAEPMLYVLPILLTWLVPGRNSTVFMAGSAIVLTWVGVVFSPGEVTPEAIANRALTSTLLLVTAVLLVRQRRLTDVAATAQHAHREIEERLRLFIEHAPVALAMFDRELRYLAVSRRWMDDYHLGKRPIIGQSHYDVFPDIPERWKVVHQRGLAGEVVRMEEDLFERADGSSQWLYWEVRPWRMNKDKVSGILIFTEDITGCKKVEEKIRASEELLRQVMGSLSAHIAVLDREGTIIAVNESWNKFAVENDAQKPSAFGIGINYLDVCRQAVSSDESARYVLEGLEDILHGRTDSFTFEYPCHWGAKQRWFELRATPLSGSRGGIVVSHENITDRKRADDVLRNVNVTLEQRVEERAAELVQANERFEWMVKATHDGVYDWDLLNHTVHYSPRWREMHGFQESELLEMSKDWSDRIHPDDRSRVLKTLEAYWQQEHLEFWEEYRVRRKDGTYMWVLDRGIAIRDDQGRAIRMVGAETDITWRKEAEEALRRQEHEFHALADNVPAFFAYIGTDLRYRYVNKRYEDLFGLPIDEITKMTVEQLLGTEGYAQVGLHLEEAFRGTTCSFDYRLEPPGMGECWLSAQYVPDRNEAGDVIGLFVLLSDITQLKLTEEILRKREEELSQLSAKLLLVQEEERRRIAREIHDDLTQRLTALTLELHHLRLSHEAERKDSLSSRLQTMTTSAEELTSDLQKLAHHLHPAILEHVGLEAAARELVEDFAAKTGLETEIMVKDLPKDIPLERATCLYRILQESLRNVQKHAKAQNVLVRILQTARGIGLCVHDDGQGFKNGVDESRRKGLGLTSMDERVKLYNGTFRVRTKPNDGTELHAWIPLQDVHGEA